MHTYIHSILCAFIVDISHLLVVSFVRRYNVHTYICEISLLDIILEIYYFIFARSSVQSLFVCFLPLAV